MAPGLWVSLSRNPEDCNQDPVSQVQGLPGSGRVKLVFWKLALDCGSDLILECQIEVKAHDQC